MKMSDTEGYVHSIRRDLNAFSVRKSCVRLQLKLSTFRAIVRVAGLTIIINKNKFLAVRIQCV